MTRHIPSEARLPRTKQTTKPRNSPKSGRKGRRPPRPRLCLTDRLANLHLLLRARSFERWPLKVTFYAEDVWKVWTRWIAQHLELEGGDGLREGIWVGLDESSKTSTNQTISDPSTAVAATPKGIHAIPVTHLPLKPHLEKSLHLLSSSAVPQTCNLCTLPLPSSGASTLICPNPSCTSTTHLTCLAEHFLRGHGEADKDKDKSSNSFLLPTTGSCPACSTPLHWREVVQELSLRMRGEREVGAIFKPVRRGRKGKEINGNAAAATEGGSEAGSESDDIAEPLLEEDEEGDEDEGEGGWHVLSETEESEVEDPAAPAVGATSSAKAPGFRRPGGFKAKKSAGPEVVVEDSDGDDEVEIIA